MVMYLIHAGLRAPEQGRALPADVAELIHTAAAPTERVEHVSVHPHAEPDPVVGIYLVSDRLTEAEARAAELCRRALATPALRGWQLGRVGVPLVAPFYEWQMTEAGLRGRNGTGPNPSI